MSPLPARLSALVFAVAIASPALADTALQVALGAGTHACVVTATGGVECWGENESGQLGDGTTTSRSKPVPVLDASNTPLSGVVEVVVALRHACARTNAGAVACWGSNVFRELGIGSASPLYSAKALPVVGLVSGVSAISAGMSASCAILSTGALSCWGQNNYGQLGDGTTTTRDVPTPVSGLTSGVTSVAVGGSHTCAVHAGAAKCWGLNLSGQLGDGTTTQRKTPTAVSSLGSGVASVANSAIRTCAVTTGGAVTCWGDNTDGGLGDGTTTQRLTPTQVSGLTSGVTAVSVQYNSACAISAAGVKCWGTGTDGQLGDGQAVSRTVPTSVVGLGGPVTSLSVGLSRACVVEQGQVKCWGATLFRDLGVGRPTAKPLPLPAPGVATRAGSLSSGPTSSGSCAVTPAGAVVCWGDNASAPLADGTRLSRPSPTEVSGLGSGMAAVSASYEYACALSVGGAVSCWGNNYFGQLGVPSPAVLEVPTAVAGLPGGIAAIATGYAHACAVSAASGVWCWGDNSSRQLGTPGGGVARPPTQVPGLPSDVVSLVAGSMHTCALTSVGAVYCWGANSQGELGIGTFGGVGSAALVTGLTTGVRAVAAGNQHTCVITAAGAVLCWGSNPKGQLGDGTTTGRAVPTPAGGVTSDASVVDAGVWHTCAARTTGQIVCWGDNTTGQLGNGTLTGSGPVTVSGLSTPVTDLTLGFGYSCARLTTGELHCWGTDEYGQLSLGDPTPNNLTPTRLYDYGGTLSLNAVSPTGGPPSGSTLVTITGAYIFQGATVTVGGVPATDVLVLTSGRLVARTPPHAAGAAAIVVTNPDGTNALLPGSFTYAPPPTVTSVISTHGPASGGTPLTITGTGFSAGATVTLGGTPATNVAVLTSTTITAVTAARIPGTVDLVVRNSDGQSGTYALAFVYDAPPTVTSVAPASGAPGGGTSITLTGSRFVTGMSVTIGGTPVTALVVVNETTATAKTAAHAPGAANVVVTHPDGQVFTQAGGFTYLPLYRRYLAEGATSAFMNTRFAVLNPGDTATEVDFVFSRAGASPVFTTLLAEAHSRLTVDAKSVAGLANAEFSTEVISDQLLVVDRTMTWDASGYGAHAETAVAAPSTVWYLAEGATHSGFDLFYLLQNPSAHESQVRVRYLRPSGAPLEKTYTLLPNSRTNIWVNQESFPGLGLALAATDVSAVFESLDATPIIVERALYLSSEGRLFNAGHESAAVTAPALQWFLAEGATGPFFDLFVLIANPNDVAANVKVTYLLTDGRTFSRTMAAPPNSRSNVWVDVESFDGGATYPLSNVAVSTTVSSENGIPVIVERSLWWPGDFATWHEAHNSAGATQTGTKWALAEGEVAGPRGEETYILIANTSPYAGTARVTLYITGGAPVERLYTLPPNSRSNVAVGPDFGAPVQGKRFGAVVESLGTTPAQIVVERAMYWDAGGATWAAGTNALATRLQ